jgi:hypothetical protein
MNEIHQWNEPVNMWSHKLIGDYIIWVKEAYGMKEAKKLFKYAKQYRAIKDLNASVKQGVYPYQQSIADTLAHSMMHTKEVISAGILNKHFQDYIDEQKQQTGDASNEQT